MTINVTEICRPNPNMLITVQSRLRLTLHKIALKKSLTRTGWKEYKE
jgi:hypothetical protein